MKKIYYAAMALVVSVAATANIAGNMVAVHGSPVNPQTNPAEVKAIRAEVSDYTPGKRAVRNAAKPASKELKQGVTVENSGIAVTRGTFSASPKAGKELNEAKNAIHKAQAKAAGAEVSDWESIGIGTWVEGLLEPLNITSGDHWDVEFWTSASNPGLYRVYPYNESNPYVDPNNEYIYVHAEDPQKVWLEPYNFLSYTIEQLVPEAGWTKYGSYGGFDGTNFTFPANSFVLAANGKYYYNNTEGKFAMHLPGAEIKDYSLSILSNLCVQDGKIEKVAFLTGDDVAAVKFGIFSGSINASDLTEDLKAYLAANGDDLPLDNTRAYLAFNFSSEVGKYSILGVTIDADGNPQDAYATSFYVVEDHNEVEWKSLGTGRFTDLFYAAQFSDLNSETYDVEVLENIATPGLYRVVEPYANHPSASDMLSEHAAHKHCLTIDATDPDYVYVIDAPAGIDAGYGEAVLSSRVSNLLNKGYDLATIKGGGITAGKLADGIITFGENDLLYGEKGYKNLTLFLCDNGALLTIPENQGGEDPNNPEKDYSYTWTNDLCYDGKLPFDIKGGADIKTVKMMLMNNTWYIEDITDEDLAYIAENGQDYSIALNQEGYYTSLSNPVPGKFTIVTVALNEENEVVASCASPFFVPENDDDWAPVGTAEFADVFLFENPKPVEVELQESLVTPGYFRLKYPYQGETGIEAHFHDHYLYLHTEDGFPWIGQAPIGFYDEIVFSATGHKMTRGYAIADIIESAELDGAINGNEVTFFAGSLFYGVQQDYCVPVPVDFKPETIVIKLNKTQDPVSPWVALEGQGIYVEGLLDVYSDIEGGDYWFVDIESNINTPGLYRLKPYNANNLTFNGKEVGGKMIIHAENPEKVWVEAFSIPEFNAEFIQMVEETNTWSDELCLEENYGKLEDGAIYFAPMSFGAIIGGSGYYTNREGKFSICLPTGRFKDYSLSIDCPSICVDENVYTFNAITGQDVAEVSVALTYNNKAAEGFTVTKDESGSVYKIDMTGMKAGQYILTAASLDENGVECDKAETIFYYGHEDEWVVVSKADYTELFVSTMYETVNSETYEVDVEENVSTPGFYRVVSPFDGHSQASLNNCTGHDGHKHCIYIHAENPAYVWVENQPYGVDFNEGHVIARSAVSDKLNKGTSFAGVKLTGTKAGKYNEEEKTITFADGALFVTTSNFGYEETTPVAGATMLKFKDGTAVENVFVDNSPVEYFNLQGMRVDGSQPGLYIVRKGNVTAKTIVR